MPVLTARDRRDEWSAISRVTVGPVAGRPGLYFDRLDHHARGEDVVALRAGLHRRLGRLTVVRDRGQSHSESKAVGARPAAHPDVAAEDSPGCVPDRNPDEGVWGRAKYGRPANLAADGRDELRGRVVDEVTEVTFRPDLPRGFIRQTGLPGVTLAAEPGSFWRLEPVAPPARPTGSGWGTAGGPCVALVTLLDGLRPGGRRLDALPVAVGPAAPGVGATPLPPAGVPEGAGDGAAGHRQVVA